MWTSSGVDHTAAADIKQDTGPIKSGRAARLNKCISIKVCTLCWPHDTKDSDKFKLRKSNFLGFKAPLSRFHRNERAPPPTLSPGCMMVRPSPPISTGYVSAALRLHHASGADTFHFSQCVNHHQVRRAAYPLRPSSGSPEPSGTDTQDFYIWRMPEHDAAIQLNLAPSRQEVKR